MKTLALISTKTGRREIIAINVDRRSLEQFIYAANKRLGMIGEIELWLVDQSGLTEHEMYVTFKKNVTNPDMCLIAIANKLRLALNR